MSRVQRVLPQTNRETSDQLLMMKNYHNPTEGKAGNSSLVGGLQTVPSVPPYLVKQWEKMNAINGSKLLSVMTRVLSGNLRIESFLSVLHETSRQSSFAAYFVVAVTAVVSVSFAAVADAFVAAKAIVSAVVSAFTRLINSVISSCCR